MRRTRIVLLILLIIILLVLLGYFIKIGSYSKASSQDNSFSDCCTSEQQQAGFKCVPNCPPPVQSEKDKETRYQCLSPENAQNREKYGCPI